MDIKKAEGPETEYTMTAQGEIECMDQIAKVLDVMPTDSRERALKWAADAYCGCRLHKERAVSAPTVFRPITDRSHEIRIDDGMDD